MKYKDAKRIYEKAWTDAALRGDIATIRELRECWELGPYADGEGVAGMDYAKIIFVMLAAVCALALSVYLTT
jgi:hypothetical protein